MQESPNRSKFVRRKNYERALVWSGMREGGLTYREISERSGIPIGTIDTALKRYGLYRPMTPRAVKQKAAAERTSHRPHNEERDREILRLLVEEHQNIGEIGRRYSLTRERIRQIVNRYGVQPIDIRNERLAAERAKPRIFTCKRCGLQYSPGEGSKHSWACRKPKWMYERDANIASDYAAGLLIDDIKKKYGVTSSTVNRIRRGAGLQRQEPGNFAKTMDEANERKRVIIELVNSGKTDAQIANTLNVSSAWVSVVRGEVGLPRNPPLDGSLATHQGGLGCWHVVSRDRPQAPSR